MTDRPSRYAVSVVMPARNEERFIEAAIKSVLAQTFKDFEFIICDDNSTDRTGEIVKSWALKDPRIRYYHSDEHNSLARAGNWCVSLANAELVARVDADDICHPERLQKQVAVLRRNPEAVLVGGLFDGIDGNSQPIYGPDYSTLYRPGLQIPCGHGVTMFRKSAFTAIGGYRIECDYWEDADFSVRMAHQGQVLFVPEILYSYRHTSGHTRRSANRIAVERALDLRARCMQAYEEDGTYEHVLAENTNSRHGRLDMNVYTSLTQLYVFAGDRPAVLQDMVRRAKWDDFAESFKALMIVLSAQISPKIVRWIKVRARKRRSDVFIPRTKGRDAVEMKWSKDIWREVRKQTRAVDHEIMGGEYSRSVGSRS